jgi:signal transduction histidine kinase
MRPVKVRPLAKNSSDPGFFSAIWRLGLRVAISLLIAILLSTFAMRWLGPVLQEQWIEGYVVSPTPFGESVALEMLLLSADQSEWPRVVAQFEEKSKGAIRARLITRSELLEKMPLPNDQIKALDEGMTLFSLSDYFSSAYYLNVYHRVGRSDIVIETITDTSRYWSLNERKSMLWIRMVNAALLMLILFAIWLLPFWWNVRKLSQVAQHLRQGELRFRVKLSRYALLYPIAESLHQLAARVQSLIDSHKNLVNAAAHELRTPLTRLKYAQRLAYEAESSGEREHYWRQAEGEVNALDSLIDELLFYAKLDRPDQEPTAITAIAADQWLMERVAAVRGLAAAIAPDVVVRMRCEASKLYANRRDIDRLASNLLGNAVRHAQQEIIVSLSEDSTHSVLVVEDDGPGIPVEDRERVFAPFVRLDESRQQTNNSGTGLGLAIVARIAEMHGGTATVVASTLGGARFVVRWPKNQPQNVTNTAVQPTPSLNNTNERQP